MSLLSDLEQIEFLYNDLCDYLEVHENYPGWKKGVYPTREDAERGIRENDYSRIYVLYTLAVHSGCLQHGFGMEILKYVEKLAEKEHYISIRLDVVKGNIPAEKLYRKMGISSLTRLVSGMKNTDSHGTICTKKCYKIFFCVLTGLKNV